MADRARTRTPEEIRLQLAGEREQLTGALAELREEIKEKRRIAAIVGGAVVAGVVAFVAVKALRD